MNRFQILKGFPPPPFKATPQPSIFEKMGRKVYFDLPEGTFEGLLLETSELNSVAGQFKKVIIEVGTNFPKFIRPHIQFREHCVTELFDMDISKISVKGEFLVSRTFLIEGILRNSLNFSPV